MALFGPRPERPELVHVLADSLPGYWDRLAVRPGITGLAQINLPPDSDLESVRRKLTLDLEYIDDRKPMDGNPHVHLDRFAVGGCSCVCCDSLNRAGQKNRTSSKRNRTAPYALADVIQEANLLENDGIRSVRL